MSISFQQALAQLQTLTANGRIATGQELRNLANSVSVAGSGSVTVLYGGEIGGVPASQIVNGMVANNPNLRVIQPA